MGKENIQKILVSYVARSRKGTGWLSPRPPVAGRSSFYYGYNGATIARTDLLLRMFHALKIPLTSLVAESIPEPEAAARNEAAMQPTRRRGVRPRRTTEQIREALQQAVAEQPAPSISDVAKRLGYSTPARLYVAGTPSVR